MTVKNSTREQRVPSDYVETKRDDDLGIQVFSSVNGLSVMGFSGRKQKPDFFFKFASLERAGGYVSEWHARKAASKAAQQAAKALSSAPHTLQVGDVLSSSWGWEQTNVDFYQVTELAGKHFIVLREIAAIAAEAGKQTMQGQCVPVVGDYKGESFRKKADGSNRVRISSFQTASPLDFQEVCGVKVYKPSHYSSYA